MSEVIAVDSLTERQVGDVYVIIRASVGGEQAALERLGRPDARLEDGWAEKVRQRFRGNIQKQLEKGQLGRRGGSSGVFFHID